MNELDTILVLGATGKTGRRLAPLLAARGCNVRRASRHPAEGDVRFDWDDPATHRAALAGANAVYVVPPALVEDASALLTPFLEQAAKAGVERVVLLSSLGTTFPAEPAHSGRHKHEQLVRDCGLAWTILRPSGFFQNFSEGFLRQAIAAQGVVVSAAGDGAAAMVDAGDIARVAAAALTDPVHAGAVYPITGPEALSFGDAAAILTQVTGRTIAYQRISVEAMAGFLRDNGIPDAYAAMLLRDVEAIRDGAAATVSDTVERVTGRRPISFADFASGAAAAWR